MAADFCPLIKKECVENKCRWYVHLLGTNPQTGSELDKWGCAVEWLPILLVESSKEARHASAAVESFRNESVNNARLLAASLQSIASVGTLALEHKGQEKP